MKRYRCHKTVSAFKITSIEPVDPENIRSPYLICGTDSSASVGPSWVERHQPHIGGYFVSYSDGYMSFSPAEAFEAGYTEIHE